jgi:hypothetical protein
MSGALCRGEARAPRLEPKMEEEVFYPTAILIGEYLKLQLDI